MADLKVTQLNQIAAADVASDDVMLIVDVSADEDKKIVSADVVTAGLMNTPSGSILGSIIANDSLDGNALIDGSVFGPKIADNAIDGNHLKVGSVYGAAALYPGSSKGHIAAASIGTADVGNDQITQALLADNSAGSAEVLANNISGSATTGSKIHIEAGSIGTSDIADGSITSAKLASGGGGLVPTGGITDADVAANAQIQVSKLEDAGLNQVLAGPATGGLPGPVVARSLVGADLPVATDLDLGAVSVPILGGLTVAGGALSITNTTFGQNLGYIAYDNNGLITSARAINSTDLPVGSAAQAGILQIGNGLQQDSFGTVDLTIASSFGIGGVKPGADFAVAFDGALDLSTTGVTAGAYPKVTVDDKGRVLSGGVLIASDIPDHSAALLTSGTLDVARLGVNTITGDKLANESTCVIQTSAPANGEFQGQFYLDSGSNSLSVWNGSSFVAVAAAALADLKADTTPQLGGPLDVDGQEIISTNDGDINLDPNGSGHVVFKGNATRGSGGIKLNCEQNSHGIVVQGPPHSAAASYTLTLPNDTGSSGQLLQTNGSGVTSWTSALTLTGITIDGPYEQVAEAVSALDIDLNNGNYFTKTINGNSTFSFSNPPASGTVGSFVIQLTHTSGTVTWPASVKFPADTAPTLTAGKTHLFFFVTDDGGTTYRGASLVDYVN